ncbi:unnamed protein product, partial [Pylaiella littoralis]
MACRSGNPGSHRSRSTRQQGIMRLPPTPLHTTSLLLCRLGLIVTAVVTLLVVLPAGSAFVVHSSCSPSLSSGSLLPRTAKAKATARTIAPAARRFADGALASIDVCCGDDRATSSTATTILPGRAGVGGGDGGAMVASCSSRGRSCSHGPPRQRSKQQRREVVGVSFGEQQRRSNGSDLTKSMGLNMNAERKVVDDGARGHSDRFVSMTAALASASAGGAGGLVSRSTQTCTHLLGPEGPRSGSCSKKSNNAPDSSRGDGGGGGGAGKNKDNKGGGG